MAKAKRIPAIVLVIGLIALLLPGCTTFDNFKEAFINKTPQLKDTIRIGVYEPMSGPDRAGGNLEIMGIQLANELHPKALGKPVELIYADNRSDVSAARTAMADLVKKQPLVVLGSYGDPYSLAGSPYLETAKIPGIAITNANPLVTSHDSYYFRVSFMETYQGVALARYAVEQLKQKKTGIIIPRQDDMSTAMASSYKNKFIELTNNEDAIAAYEQYQAGQADFTKELGEIQKSGVKTVFLSGSIRDDTQILRQAQQMGLKATFLGDSNWSSQAFINAAGGYISHNVAFSTLYNESQEVTAASQQFLAAYQGKYGAGLKPDPATALGFDAYMLALDAITRSGPGSSGEDVRNALAQTVNFQGASGEITFNGTGDPIKSVVINTIANGQVEPVYTIQPSDAAAPAPAVARDKSTKKTK